MIKKLLVVAIFFLTIGSAAAANPDNMGNKYVVNDFSICDGSFNAAITNQNGGADNFGTGGTWELSTSPAANHKNVLLSGTFAFSLETILIGESYNFEPGTYYLIVYTNYDDNHDNRVSKVKCVYTGDDNPEDNPV